MAQWESLVTDGHVRGARWRISAKYIVGVGALLILLGIVGIWLLPKSTTVSGVAQAKQELVNARQRALAKFMEDKGAAPPVPPENAERAVAPNDMPRLIGSLLDSLNKTNALPPTITVTDPETFWSGNWTSNSVTAVASGRTILVGFYVNETAVTSYQPLFGRLQAPAPRLRRVFGLFRQATEGTPAWAFYCLQVPGAEQCGAGEPVFPATIPATLRDLTPASAREP